MFRIGAFGGGAWVMRAPLHGQITLPKDPWHRRLSGESRSLASGAQIEVHVLQEYILFSLVRSQTQDKRHSLFNISKQTLVTSVLQPLLFQGPSV